jgi:signal transduction histidine kinase/DNA-binding response OmpR family regulator
MKTNFSLKPGSYDRVQRILIVDDNESIHEDFRKLLQAAASDNLQKAEQDLFGTPAAISDDPGFDFQLSFAFSGKEALHKVTEAGLQGRPFRVMFCDIRMPPGWDGIETISQCWKVDPGLEVVICSAYSDYTWKDLINRLGRTDQFLVLRKPFEAIEIRQLAMSLCMKNLMKASMRGEVKNLEQIAEEQSRVAAEAEKASHAKGEFLANVSHEIRTPLNGVIGMLELLGSTPMNSQQERYLRGAQSSADCLLSLVNGVLDLSRVEHGQMELESITFDLRTLVENVTEMMSPTARKKCLEINCQLSADLPECVSGDHNRLRQILLNLVNNAVKFTEQGRVTISAEVLRRGEESDVVRIAVSDTGIGIPKERQGRLFQLFSQIDASTTRRFGGTGLGLALCKRLVELMGGTIGVESEAGWGSTFWFSVPLKKAVAEAPMQVVPAYLSAMQILVIIGDDSARTSVTSALDQWNISCSAFRTVSEASSRVAASMSRGDQYSLAIVSARDHGSSGRLLIEEFRGTDGLQDLPTIAVINANDSAPLEFRQRWRISEVVSCPIRRSRLFDAVQHTSSELVGTEVATMVCELPTEKLATAGHGYRILVAEDYEINQVVVREFLTRFGFECQLVSDGQEAVEKATTRQFDLVLMDCQMPEMDGFQATEEIRKVELTGHGLSRSGSRLPVIALTANAISGDREVCIASGMDDYLSKPINKNALLDVLRKWLPRQPVAQADHGNGVTSASGAGSTASGSITGFDRNQLIHQCFGDVDLAIELLKMFEVRGASSLKEIKKAVADENRKALNHISHGIKGIAGNLCAHGLQKSAAQLETRCKDESVTLHSLLEEIETFCGDIQTCLSSAAPLRQTLLTQKA